MRFKVIDKADKKNLHGFNKKVTKPETEAIYTDQERGYLGIGDQDTRHETVNHGAGEYVRPSNLRQGHAEVPRRANRNGQRVVFPLHGNYLRGSD